ncbi:glutamate--tRNA ligase [Candidatus Parcubacteria bacterium]|nr:glutamate--tRNA ligase [Candidatus Parcubacteria bacterium]
MKSKNNVVVRMAPSPTGNLHIGTARTTLFNYLFAKKMGGKFITRIEDTDKERSKKEFEANILDGLAWLGLAHDELYRQSERTDVYIAHLKKMLENGSVYVSHEEPKEEGQRSEVIRFKNPNKKISFEDEIRGTIEFDTTDLGDFVVAKSESEPLYHLAVVVDDHEMGITHVIRGEDHISNTPRQILIQEAIGAARPVYAHVPLILAPDRTKLSKRKHGEVVWVDTYKTAGYLPEAMVNYLALLGWNPGTEEEIFTMEELIKQFDLKKIQKGGAIFDQKKLDWVNKEHIKRLPAEEQRKLLLKLIKNEPYMVGEPTLDAEKIAWKKSTKEEAITHLEEAKKIIASSGNLMAYAEREGKGNVLWPLRYALTGAEASPDPLTLLEILGQEKSLKRIEHAIMVLNEAR